MKRTLLTRLGLALLAISAGAGVLAQSQAKRPTKLQGGARPPVWSKSVLDVLFPNASRELGEPSTRVANRTAANPAAPATPAVGAPAPAAAANADGFAWSKLVSATTLEDEIKGSVNLVAADLQTPSKFKGGGNENT